MKSNHSAFVRLVLLFLALVLAGRAAALQISLNSDTNFLTDFSVSPTMQSDHVSVSITNTDGVAYSNLWVTLGSFTNTSLQLGSGDPGQYPVGILANNRAGAAFFYVQATNDPGNRTYNNQFTVRVYKGLPAVGTLLASSNFPVVVQGTISANANKINSVTFTPTNNPVVGGTVKISVFGDTGGVGSGAILDFTGASWTNWNAAAFQLVACSITVTNGSNPSFNQSLTNTLTAVANSHFTGNGNLYEADYWFRAVATTGTNATPVSAISYIQSGGQTKHTSLSAGQLPPVLPATNLTTLNSLVNSTQLYTNQTVTFALVVSNLSAAYSVTLDRFVDTLPAGFVYVPNSSTFGGAPILEPTNVSGVLTWSQGNTYTVPAGASGNFVFQAIVPGVSSPTYFTNSCVAYVQNFQIGSNLTNNAPATETVRALIAPIAGSVTNTNAFENQVLTVPAPGVLANTVEPNGFTPTVISNSQPANGSATVNTDGSYTYTPAAFFWGWDSFTFTLTNGNSRVSTGTNYVYVNWVNQPPYFTAGPGQTNIENAGPVSVSNWASGISPGTNDPGQVLTFHVSNDNSSLFSVQPAVSTNGTLAYTPAPFAWGDANVSVYLTDDAGGISSTQTFRIHINWVNQPPYFTAGANQTNNENAGPASVSNWATGISPGTNDPAQVLTFHVSNNNNGLFSVQPAVSTTGALTYTSAANAFGAATLNIYLTDDAGGISATQTFTITINQVNQPPTLNTITNLNLVENWTLQTVAVSGITAGPTNESTQTLTVSATSSNPSLIPNPTISYGSPNSTGSLAFTPVTNNSGSATITVIVHDNGGTASGGIDSLTNTFLVTETGLTNYWFANSNLTVNVFDANGGAGSGYSQTNYTGVLSVLATATNPFTIKLASFNGGSPGPAANFNYASNYNWTIATTTRGVIGFATNDFVVDTSAFTNDLAGGYFTVTLSPDGNSVDLVFISNYPPPTANPVLLTRALNTSLKISIANVLTNYTTDPQGDARVLMMADAGTNGSAIYTNGAYIFYASTNNLPESFIYVVADARAYRPGDTVLMATNWISISVTNALGVPQSIATSGGGPVAVKFAGVPGYGYDVLRSTDLSAWSVVFTTNAPPNGIWIYTDDNPPQPSAFYRTQQH